MSDDYKKNQESFIIVEQIITLLRLVWHKDVYKRQDIENVTSRIDAMMTLGRNYKSFAGIKEDMAGSTKFIIETEGVD